MIESNCCPGIPAFRYVALVTIGDILVEQVLWPCGHGGDDEDVSEGRQYSAGLAKEGA